jgi:SAM-dependent methyltransferase
VVGDVLVYVFDPDAVIEDIQRVLRPGGKLIITVPNLASIGNRLLMMYGRPPHALEVRPCQGNYWRYFTFDTMRGLLEDHGFVILRMESSVFALTFYQMPLLSRFFAPKPEWKRSRFFFSKTLARIFPTMGHNIVVLAEKSERP